MNGSWKNNRSIRNREVYKGKMKEKQSGTCGNGPVNIENKL